MVNSRLLRWGGLLAFVGCLVAVTNCHDFEEAFEACKANGDCFPDEDNDGVADAFDGCPSDKKAPLAGDLRAGKCDPSSQLCLRHECPIEGDYEFSGLWGSSATDVILAARSLSLSPAWFVRFGGTTFTSEEVADTGFQPWRLHGSSATNLWAINESAGACSVRKLAVALPDGGPDDGGVVTAPDPEDGGVVTAPDVDAGTDAGTGGSPDSGTGGPADSGTVVTPDAGPIDNTDAGPIDNTDAGPIDNTDAGVDGGTGSPDAGTGTVNCPSPVYRFTDGTWTQVAYGDGTSQLQPPAIFAAEPSKAWAAAKTGDVVRWDNGSWSAEPLNLGTGAAPKAFWGDVAAPRFAVGADSRQSAATWQRTSNTWSGPATLSSGPFIAISGPSEDHLYAATASSVFKWNRTTSQWDLDTPASGQATIQDLWVSGDGSEVWVALNSATVLRKQGPDWQMLTLPVAPTFMAYRIIGFDTPDKDLWITGTHDSQAFKGTIAYHFSRQP
ncbi:hypothetical protein [Hyalangium minutum]|uniref:Uncharacterized protein n=1 Tax=Hyalangium minutum TaxID=394096 RepID=A0A085WWQ0_9BACT|nr:hypothetical protein [Hyalangium minutum]KFE72113.1 hypothetical protein DB31_0374 [Hyalangium minutum]